MWGQEGSGKHLALVQTALCTQWCGAACTRKNTEPQSSDLGDPGIKQCWLQLACRLYVIMEPETGEELQTDTYIQLHLSFFAALTME